VGLFPAAGRGGVFFPRFSAAVVETNEVGVSLQKQSKWKQTAPALKNKKKKKKKNRVGKRKTKR